VLASACSTGPATPPDSMTPSALPDRLSDTGLYSDFANKLLATDLTAFAPTNVLWSDGAVKLRWFRLPPGGSIDTTDMDHWRFPVGTQLFKEFSLDGKRLETRLIWRVGDTGNREADTLFGAYVWDDTESEAWFASAGAENLRGTQHDAPAAALCWRCHLGEPGRALGVSALQLGDVSGLPLSNPPPAGMTFAAPNPALGYLHANCGHCHNPNGGAWANASMVLRLGAFETDAATTQIAQTTVGVPLVHWVDQGFADRIVAGVPDQSAVLYRMTQRTMLAQMPPLATEFPDDTGIAVIRAWIESL